MFQHTASGKGKLVVTYNSLDELEGILAHITLDNHLDAVGRPLYNAPALLMGDGSYVQIEGSAPSSRSAWPMPVRFPPR